MGRRTLFGVLLAPFALLFPKKAQCGCSGDLCESFTVEYRRVIPDLESFLMDKGWSVQVIEDVLECDEAILRRVCNLLDGGSPEYTAELIEHIQEWDYHLKTIAK